MPQASEELRGVMREWFGSIDLYAPLDFLISRGYTNDKNGIIRPPTFAHSISDAEGECICFLTDEWDYAFHPWTKDAYAKSVAILLAVCQVDPMAPLVRVMTGELYAR